MPLQKPGITNTMAYTEIELKQKNLTELCGIFFEAHRIPLGFFDKEGNLQKQFFGPGRRQTALYLADSASILHTEYGAALPTLRLDAKGACWSLIPLNGGTLLFGPVQTGSCSYFPYESIPEHSWNGMRGISRSLVSLVLGQEAPLVEKNTAISHDRIARKMVETEREKMDLDPYDEIFDCVRNGDLEQLDRLFTTSTFLDYQDQINKDMETAVTVFYFNLAKTYHTALDAGVPINDAAPLVGLYIGEMRRYRSIASFKAGIQRMLYDFTRYTSQYTNKSYSPLVNRALMYIGNHLYSPVSASTVAEHCKASVSTLQHRFKEETGRSISDVIRDKKTERACYFLKHTDLPCSDIAFKMGYCSQSYFISQFKKVMGVTPNDYRIQS